MGPLLKHCSCNALQFETMIQSKQIGEFRCFYEKAGKKFHSVVQLGKDVCGFPQTVHGGLTAGALAFC